MAANRYRVTGAQPVAGHQPGEELTDKQLAAHGVTTAEQKHALLEGGAITPLATKRPATKKPAAKAAAKPANTQRQED